MIITSHIYLQYEAQVQQGNMNDIKSTFSDIKQCHCEMASLEMSINYVECFKINFSTIILF